LKWSVVMRFDKCTRKSVQVRSNSKYYIIFRLISETKLFLCFNYFHQIVCSFSSFTGFDNPLEGFSLLILDVSRSHTMTQSVGLLWTSDQPVAETST
jgi:hypothetical protein